MKTERILLLSEDECAPDAREYFIKKMEKLFKLSFKKIKEAGTRVDPDHATMEWHYQDYILSIAADDPFYKLEQIKEI
jgi:hypothetical protein